MAIELVAAVLLGWLLTRRHADHPAPMLPIDLFRRPMFALSAATSVCSFAVQGLAFVSLPFYFEDVLLRSQVDDATFAEATAAVRNALADHVVDEAVVFPGNAWIVTARRP